MPLKEQFAAERQRWKLLTVYQKFEHAVILMLTALIAVVVAFDTTTLIVSNQLRFYSGWIFARLMTSPHRASSEAI